MKNLDLSNYGVQEMNAREMKEIEGGNPAFLLLLFCLAMGFLKMAES